MASYFVGNSAGNGDSNAGTGIVVVTFIVDWFDQGSFGSAPPNNGKIQVPFVLKGNIHLTRRAVDPNPVLVTFTLASNNTATGFRTAAKVTAPVLATTIFLTGKTDLVLFLQEEIVFAVFVGGSLDVQAYGLLTREFYNDLLGVRQSFPWLIYAVLTHSSQVRIGSTYQQPVNKAFMIDGEVDVTRDPYLVSLGGKPNWIGVVSIETVNNAPIQVVRFRAPELNEVVVLVPKEDEQGGSKPDILVWDGSVWKPYTTLPQRAIGGQPAFELFDPDQVYDYYTKLVGLMHVQWQYDTDHLGTFGDPLACPDPFVSLLADNFGLDIANETATDDKRAFIRQFVALEKEKGVPQSIVDALHVLGFTGYAMQIWVIPGGGPYDYIEKPFGYDVDPPSTYFPASQISIHINGLDGLPLAVIDDGMRSSIGEFLGQYILPAKVVVRFFATDIPVRSAGESVGLTDSIVITNV